jgi:hypothetical protein
MMTRGLVIVSVVLLCAPLTSAQSNRALHWSTLSMGSYAARSSNRIVRGIVGQESAGTTRMGNLMLTAGFLADTLFKEITVSAGESQAVPTTYELCQNYPNPFNPTTVVTGQLPVVSQVRVAVYDILGRQVAVLMDEKKEAGKFQVIWNARSCASGVYICRMTAGPYSMSRKMILAR